VRCRNSRKDVHATSPLIRRSPGAPPPPPPDCPLATLADPDDELELELLDDDELLLLEEEELEELLLELDEELLELEARVVALAAVERTEEFPAASYAETV